MEQTFVMTLPNHSSGLTHCCVCGEAILQPEKWLAMCPACWGNAGLRVLDEISREMETIFIKGYRILRRIASGGMGTVFEAACAGDERRVAIKIMRRELAQLPRFLELFRRECAVLELLDHPHIVRFVEAGEVDGVPYMVMDLIDGPNLQQVLRKGPLPVPRALAITVQVCSALRAAHERQMIHRDIKPANILLNQNGEVKVMDFGLARLLQMEAGTSQPSSLIALGGHYTAPELERYGTGDARADIYSTGALLYHLLTGHPPRANYQPARKAWPKSRIAVSVDKVIERALQPLPEDRYPTMAEMQKALEREQSRLARPGPSVWTRSLAVVALLFLLGWTWVFLARPHDQEQQTHSRLAPPPPLDWQQSRWVNSLGMPFVSIPGCAVQFCIWETRVSDYAAFAEPVPDPDDAWVQETGFAFPLKKPVFSLRHGEFKAAGQSWQSPGFLSGPDHAVCGVSASDAMAFCTWLTWVERRQGGIRADQTYRLPSDQEWSAAAGLVVETGATPQERAGSWPPVGAVYLWGNAWPAPDNLYNVAGDEVNDWEDWHPSWTHRPRRDPWRGTAPVQAMPPSLLGLHHLTGNVWEWTESSYNQGSEKHALVLRGGSWLDASPDGLSLSYRDRDIGTMRMTKRGFRVVFQPSGASGWRYGGGQ